MNIMGCKLLVAYFFMRNGMEQDKLIKIPMSLSKLINKGASARMYRNTIYLTLPNIFEKASFWTRVDGFVHKGKNYYYDGIIDEVGTLIFRSNGVQKLQKSNSLGMIEKDFTIPDEEIEVDKKILSVTHYSATLKYVIGCAKKLEVENWMLKPNLSSHGQKLSFFIQKDCEESRLRLQKYLKKESDEESYGTDKTDG